MKIKQKVLNKPPVDRIRKHGATEFKATDSDDAEQAEFWLDNTIRALDMTPYLSSSIVRSRFGNRMFAFECENTDSSAEYEIFAVIAHSGMLESGHYVTYLHVNNQWYKCDDAWKCEYQYM